MKWLLIFLTMSVNNATCNGPLTLVKHADEIYDSQAECEKAFHDLRFYRTPYKQEIMGFCLGPVKAMYLSPTQLRDRVEPPKCP